MLDYPIIIYIYGYLNYENMYLLNKKLNIEYKKILHKKSKIIQKWYLTLLQKKHILDQNPHDFTDVYKISKSLIIRQLLSLSVTPRINKMFLILPEFISMYIKDIRLHQNLESLNLYSERKKSETVSFLLSQYITSKDIVNVFMKLSNLYTQFAQ